MFLSKTVLVRCRLEIFVNRGKNESLQDFRGRYEDPWEVSLPGLGIGMGFFKWKMLRLSGPNASLFLQLLIALVTMSAMKVSAISIGFLLVSLVTNRVSLEEECLPSFEVLNLAASCLDNETRFR